MREIKFRAWDWIMFLPKTSFISFDWNWQFNKDLILMQYAWLKDKNWKEIYFYDIIKHQDYIYEVVWNYDCIWFKQIKVTITDFSIYTDWWECLKVHYGKTFKRKELFHFESCEIIWNIYENPELLTN